MRARGGTRALRYAEIGVCGDTPIREDEDTDEALPAIALSLVKISRSQELSALLWSLTKREMNLQNVLNFYP